VGEDIVSNATAAKIVTRVTDGFSLQEAFAKTFAELLPYDGFAGAIAIDKDGNIFHQDSHRAWCLRLLTGETSKFLINFHSISNCWTICTSPISSRNTFVPLLAASILVSETMAFPLFWTS
jgi:hypothetical protein